MCADPERRVVASASRRAGKSVGALRKSYDVAMGSPGVKCWIFGQTLQSARENYWRPAMGGGIAQLGIGHLNERDTTCTLPNGSTLRLIGCDDVSEIRKTKGVKLALAVVDEAQDYRDEILRDLVFRALEPTLAKGRGDEDGQILIVGSPGLVPPTGRPDDPLWATLAHGPNVHTWTAHSNTGLYATPADYDAYVDRVCAENGWTRESPIVRREYLGQWCADSSELFVPLGPDSLHDGAPDEYDYTCAGVDIGHSDADAIVVLAVSISERTAWEVETVVQSGQTQAAFEAAISRIDAEWSPTSWLCDTGGMGAKTVASANEVLGLSVPLMPAAKKNRALQLRKMGDAVRLGRVKLARGGRLHSESLRWVKKPGTMWEEGRYHSDCMPALQYCLQGIPELSEWIADPKPPPPVYKRPWHAPEDEATW